MVVGVRSRKSVPIYGAKVLLSLETILKLFDVKAGRFHIFYRNVSEGFLVYILFCNVGKQNNN